MVQTTIRKQLETFHLHMDQMEAVTKRRVMEICPLRMVQMAAVLQLFIINLME